MADLKGGADSREEVLSDYRVYHLTGQEWIRYLLEGTAVCAVTAYVFYRSFLAFVLMLPAGMLRPFFKRRELCRRRKEELRLQFKEAIQIVASALAAGYSVENAFIASVRDLEEQYGKEGMITREFSYLASQLKMNRTVEALLSSFAKRSGLDEVENFSVIFTVSKRSRGELASVVHHVVHVISDRIQVREEILTMTAEKQFEQRIMNLMPYLIVLYVDLSSPGFFSQMYETAVGRVVMTGCLPLQVHKESQVYGGRKKNRGQGEDREESTEVDLSYQDWQQTTPENRWQVYPESEEAYRQELRREEEAQIERAREAGTTLLSASKNGEGTVRLEPVEAGGTVIQISYIPFTLGKHPGLSDACIDRPTVSRLHARIDQKEGVYILTDLNSTNGTSVNGYPLQANETVSLGNGDSIYLADVGYKFWEHR